MEIGKRLRYLRKERKETQLQVAESVGTAMRHYQRFELGEALPGLELFCALADHFQVNADYLLGRTDVRDMLPPSSEREARP